MKNIELKDLASWIDAENKGNCLINGIKVDNRLIEPGDLFVCLRGERVDGHDYAAGAIEKGAASLLVDHYLELDVPQILVEDTYKGLVSLAKAYRNRLDSYFIGITGSNGKTSTKDILNSVLSLVGKTNATHQNQNTVIGTCLNIFNMDYDSKYGVFEIGLDYPGDIKSMVDILRPHASLVTSLAPTHVVNFEDVMHIAKEKFSIFDQTQNKEGCFYQGDFKEYRELDKGYHSFGFNKDNEYYVNDVVIHNEGIEFSVNEDTYTSNVLGKHQASNCGGIIALLQYMNIEDSIIRKGLMNVTLTALRTQIVTKNKALILLDAYKSNPSSTTYALEILNNYEYKGPKSVILSDMVELGDESIEFHKEILRILEKSNLKHVLLFGPDFKEALKYGILNEEIVQHFDAFEDLFQASQDMFEISQMILIKGSRRYALERLLKEVDV